MFSVVGPIVPFWGFTQSTVEYARTVRGGTRLVFKHARELRRDFQDEMIGWGWLILDADNYTVRRLLIVKDENEKNPDGWRWERTGIERANRGQG